MVFETHPMEQVEAYAIITQVATYRPAGALSGNSHYYIQFPVACKQE